jgi:Ni,Fe-hydrogenase maturation factor
MIAVLISDGFRVVGPTKRDDAIVLGELGAELAVVVDAVLCDPSTPGRLVIFAVQAADVSLGVGLSPAVAAAVPTLTSAVLAELGERS